MLRVNKLTRSLATLSNRTPAPILLEQHPRKIQDTLPTFTISSARGFLPRQDPLTQLPKEFNPIESLLNRMTIKQQDGTRGLLALGQFGDAVQHELKGQEMRPLVEKAIASNDKVSFLLLVSIVLPLFSLSFFNIFSPRQFLSKN